MTKKERIDSILSRVDEDKKEAFIQAIREAKTKEEKKAVLTQYGLELSGEELTSLQIKELPDDELENVAGGCNCYGCMYDCSCTK